MKTGKKEGTKENKNIYRVKRNCDDLKKHIKKEDLKLLTKKQRSIVSKRLAGKKIEDIAKEMGYTKQYISWAIISATNRILKLRK